MPKRAKKKALTDEEKKAAFENWKNTDEYKEIVKMQDEIMKNKEIESADNGTTDITEDWTACLTQLYALGTACKLTKRKPKCKCPFLAMTS